MKCLAIETSTEACSAALMYGSETISKYVFAPREHANLILQQVQDLLLQAQISIADLDLLVLGQGPGSFTGVRIAASVVQGFSFAYDIPVARVSSLAALAQGVYRQYGKKSVLVAFDARMKEVYWGQYQWHDGLMLAMAPDIVCAPENIPVLTKMPWFAAGSGWLKYGAVMASINECQIHQEVRFPNALDLLPLGLQRYENKQWVVAELALPAYVRNQVTHSQSPI